MKGDNQRENKPITQNKNNSMHNFRKNMLVLKGLKGAIMIVIFHIVIKFICFATIVFYYTRNLVSFNAKSISTYNITLENVEN